MSNIRVIPVDLFSDTSITYDQTKTSLLGRITNKTIAGKTVVGAPVVQYRNTVTGPEALTPNDIHATSNNRVFILGAIATTTGLAQIACYSINQQTGVPTLDGSIIVKLPAPPTTTYTVRGFRVLDNGTTGWKIAILVTANQAAHAGLYVVDNLVAADFTSVPPTIPTATAPAQKAVYRYDVTGPTNMLDGTGLIMDTVNSLYYVHRGVAATHFYSVFDYSATITTVGLLGQTDETFLHSTGNLPALTGTLLLTNSEELTTPTSGPNSGQLCAVFHTTTTMYRGQLSELTTATTAWPSLEIANNQVEPNLETSAPTTVRAAYSDSLQKVILFAQASTYPASFIIKNFASNEHDLRTTVLSPDNNEATVKEIHKFKLPNNATSLDSRNGFIFMTSAQTGVRGLYVANFDADTLYDQSSIISPVINVQNQIMTRFTVGIVRPDLGNRVTVFYRTSGFGTAGGGWVTAPEDLDLGSLVSPTNQVQFKITFRTLENERTNPTQLYSAGIIVIDQNSNSTNWEYSHDDSSPGNPSRVAFRLKKTYASSVPQLTFRARDLSDNLYVQSNTTVDAGLFEYSTDGGVNWIALGTIPNTIGTLLRYTFAVPPGISVRPSIRES